MITKLTLTIDDSIIALAKKYARNKGKSLSDIVENYLLTLTSAETRDDSISPRIRRLIGAIELPADFDYKKTLETALERKHKL